MEVIFNVSISDYRRFYSNYFYHHLTRKFRIVIFIIVAIALAVYIQWRKLPDLIAMILIPVGAIFLRHYILPVASAMSTMKKKDQMEKLSGEKKIVMSEDGIMVFSRGKETNLAWDMYLSVEVFYGDVVFMSDKKEYSFFIPKRNFKNAPDPYEIVRFAQSHVKNGMD